MFEDVLEYRVQLPCGLLFLASNALVFFLFLELENLRIFAHKVSPCGLLFLTSIAFGVFSLSRIRDDLMRESNNFYLSICTAEPN